LAGAVDIAQNRSIVAHLPATRHETSGRRVGDKSGGDGWGFYPMSGHLLPMHDRFMQNLRIHVGSLA